jgi:hypothetical protein
LNLLRRHRATHLPPQGRLPYPQPRRHGVASRPRDVAGMERSEIRERGSRIPLRFMRATALDCFGGRKPAVARWASEGGSCLAMTGLLCRAKRVDNARQIPDRSETPGGPP